MSESVLQLVEHFGYAAVGLLILVEGLGVPLPGEASLLVAAAIAGTSGRLSLAGVIVAAAAGAILGAAGGYWLGASLSDQHMVRIAGWFGLGSARLERAQRIFRDYGRRTALFGRFFTLLRMLVALLAGASRVPFAEFMLFSSLGAVLWATLYGTLGYVFGSNLPRLEHAMGRATIVGASLLLLAGVLLYLSRRRAGRVEEP